MTGHLGSPLFLSLSLCCFHFIFYKPLPRKHSFVIHFYINIESPIYISSTSNTSNTNSISKIKHKKLLEIVQKKSVPFLWNYTEIFFPPVALKAFLFPSLKYKLILPSLPALITIYLNPGQIKLNPRYFFYNYCYDC